MAHDPDPCKDDISRFTFPAYKDWRNIDYIPIVGLVPLDSDEIVMTSTYLGKKSGIQFFYTREIILCE